MMIETPRKKEWLMEGILKQPNKIVGYGKRHGSHFIKTTLERKVGQTISRSLAIQGGR